MVRYELNGRADEQELNALFEAAWPRHTPIDFGELIARSLLHVIAYDDESPVGFVRVVGCGRHGIVFGPTVHPEAQGRGVGTGLLNEAASSAEQSGLEALHVEFAPQLRAFYGRAGFRHTAAGVRRLSPPEA